MIQFQEIDSKNELLERFRKTCNPKMLLERDDGYSSHYGVLEVSEESINVMVFIMYFGLNRPKYLQWQNTIFIENGTTAYCIDRNLNIRKWDVQPNIDLFLPIINPCQLLVISDLDILAISNQFEKKWLYNAPDLIVDLKIHENFLTVVTDSSTDTIDLFSGKIIAAF